MCKCGVAVCSRTAHPHANRYMQFVNLEFIVFWPIKALYLIETLVKMKVVNFWKIGKLNHNKKIENTVNWEKFLRDVRLLLNDQLHYIKSDLLKFEK